MSLITCPDCHKEISDSAPLCPHCGRPMRPATQTVELTSKEYKAIMAIGGLIMAIGTVIAFGTHQTLGGGVMMLIGFVIFFIGRVAAWWQHE